MSETKGYSLSVYNPFPGDGGAPTTPAGGSWAGSTISFCLVAFREATESWDTAGWITTIPANWKNIPIVASDKLVISWTWPTGLPEPDHYGLYWQAGTTFTLGSVATRALLTAGGSANIPGNVLTATLEAPGTATGTIPASYTSITLTPIVTPGPRPTARQLKGLDIAGIAFRQTFSFTSVTLPDSTVTVEPWFGGLSLPLMRFSCSDANRKTLIQWGYSDCHVLLTDSATGDNHLVKHVYGALNPVPYLNTNCKGEPQDLQLDMLVEGIVLA